MSITTQLLERRLGKLTDDEAVRLPVGALRDQIARLANLLAEFRSLSRRQQFLFRPTNLRDLPLDVLTAEAPLYAERQITVELHFVSDLPVVHVDQDKFKQVALNLCKNAVEAMPEGGTLTVQVQHSGTQVQIEIADKVSGRDTHRPQLQAMLAYTREGDTIVVHSMDRLARNVDDLRRLVQEQTRRGIRMQFLKENLTFTGDDSPLAHLMLSVLGSVAQFERDLIQERQRDGIALAKKRGAYRGRKKALDADRLDELRRRVQAGEKKSKVARELGISRETLYQYLRQGLPHRERGAPPSDAAVQGLPGSLDLPA